MRTMIAKLDLIEQTARRNAREAMGFGWVGASIGLAILLFWEVEISWRTVIAFLITGSAIILWANWRFRRATKENP